MFASFRYPFSYLTTLAIAALLQMTSGVEGQTQRFTHFEARQTHSIGLTPDGTKLLALNSPAALLSVFAVSPESTALVRIAEIPVGLEPVAVRARTDDEVWVVNEVGDSVSIVSLSRKAVIATLAASDEPSDIVFAQGKAFVSCARNGLIRVYDAVTKAELPSILLGGLDPRSLATDATGTHVYAAFLLSGNRTTILPRTEAPPQPDPTNSNLPPPPDTSLIVSADDVRIDRTVLDRDVVMIEAASGQVVKYFGGIGTNLFDLAVHPGSGELWVANTEALNLVRFEPVLRGHFVDHRLTKLGPEDGATEVFDLNDGIDYGTLPNAAAQAEALAQPTALVFADQQTLWMAAFASDRVAKIDGTTGAVLTRLDIRLGGGSAAVMRGPRALALHPTASRLYVLNKLSETVSTIDTQAGTVVAEVPIASVDPMPAEVRAGRGFLFDARQSGNGTASCAACHIDADRDGLAWDLGDPNGEMLTVMGANLSAHDTVPRPRVIHPMKGPMVTQTLRGMENGAPFHWRGDRPTLQSFNGTFNRLMGGTELGEEDIDAMAAYLLSLRNHPNPNRTKTGALPTSFAGGNPRRGQDLFLLHDNHCGICHLAPKGSDNNIDLPQEVGLAQPVKNPPLATVYQRLFFDSRPGSESLSGFGLLHDGTGFLLPTVHPYVLDQLATAIDFADVQAFVLCFDTGTSPVVGDSFTVTAQTLASAGAELTRLESMVPGAGDLIVRGMIGGVLRRFSFSRSRQVYIPESLSEAPLTRAALLALLGAEDALTFVGVQPFEGARFSGAENRDPVLVADSYFVRNTKTPLSVPVAKGVMTNDVNVAVSHDAAAIAVPPERGEATMGLDGAFTYTAGSEFLQAGFDRFEYRVLIATDPGNVTETAGATVSTMAAAAGSYSGYVKADATSAAVGFAKIKVAANGSWTGSAKVGGKTVALRGTIGTDGTLLLAGRPKLAITLRLSAPAVDQREIGVVIDLDGSRATGVLPRSAYSAKAPAPNPGRHSLSLTVANSSGDAPLSPGRATLALKRTGGVVLKGKLGDGTAFSCSGVASPRLDGGWRFMIYAAVYKFPPGSVSGDVEFDPSVPLQIEGTMQAVKPPQTRTGPYQTGFTIEYHVSKVVQP